MMGNDPTSCDNTIVIAALICQFCKLEFWGSLIYSNPYCLITLTVSKSICSLLPVITSTNKPLPRHIYHQETQKVPPLNMPSGHIWISNTGCQAWYFLLAPIYLTSVKIGLWMDAAVLNKFGWPSR